MSHLRPILITGANGGIGSGLVTYLKARGYENIVCQYHREDNKLRELFGAEFNRHCFRADLTKESELDGLHQHVLDFFGQIYAVINLAGASTSAMSWKLPVEEFQQVMNANLLTTFLTCRKFIPELRSQGVGRIINTSSIVAHKGVAGAAHYCAAKAAITGFTKAIALELANKNITANVLALGYFNCGLIEELAEVTQEVIKNATPVKRLGRVEDIGGLVEYLLSDEGSFMTGQVHHLNGGLYL